MTAHEAAIHLGKIYDPQGKQLIQTNFPGWWVLIQVCDGGVLLCRDFTDAELIAEAEKQGEVAS